MSEQRQRGQEPFRVMSRPGRVKKAVLDVRETHGHTVEFSRMDHDQWQDDEGRNVVNGWSHHQGTDVPRSPNRRAVRH